MPQQKQCAVPVLLILKERSQPPSALRRVLQEATPRKVYVASIGAAGAGNNSLSSELPGLDRHIDWPCEVQQRVFPESCGPAYTTCRAISWFFGIENQGIVLSGESTPSSEFFAFCEWGLATYAHQPSVWHINDRLEELPPAVAGNATTAITPYTATGCWASWQDRWQSFDANPFYVADQSTRLSGSWPVSSVARLNILRRVYELRSMAGDWEPLWQATILNNAGRVLCPGKNWTGHPEIGPAENLSEPDPALTRWHESRKGLRSGLAAARFAIAIQTRRMSKLRKRMLKRALFGPVSRPVVVASNGRSGSTMLCESIGAAVVRSRYGKALPSWVESFLRKRAVEFVPRLRQIPASASPVIKTHDRPDNPAEICGKVIFVFGDPLEAALSAGMKTEREGCEWFMEHLYNLRSRGYLSDLFETDVLSYQEQCDAWGKAPQDSVMLIPYDELWDRESEIARFLDLPVQLPERKARRPKPSLPSVNDEVFDKLLDHYRRLCAIARERSRS